jgi:hypothetical protein
MESLRSQTRDSSLPPVAQNDTNETFIGIGGPTPVSPFSQEVDGQGIFGYNHFVLRV